MLKVLGRCVVGKVCPRARAPNAALLVQYTDRNGSDSD